MNKLAQQLLTEGEPPAQGRAELVAVYAENDVDFGGAFAYYKGTPTPEQLKDRDELMSKYKDNSSSCSPLFGEEECGGVVPEPEEIPNEVSQYAGLERWYVAPIG